MSDQLKRFALNFASIFNLFDLIKGKSTVVSISTLTSLLSTLCRNSDSITKEILESNILESVEKALYGDERCVLDTIRFLDLLLTLIFEGRDALPKNRAPLSFATSITSSTSPSNLTEANKVKLKRVDPAIEKFYRQLIEWIRVKDTDSLIEALETNPVDINFMDDVGQTLMNWTSAFGTAEMAEYLASKGADVNKGQRSSSLHYAACFGRANIVKILLRHGANPDLRDEEGKTALDKARERGEECHREVVQILQAPTDYLNLGTTNTMSVAALTAPAEENISNLYSEPIYDEQSPVQSAVQIENLDEIRLNYTKRLLPTLCKVFINCMIQSINKSCLNLLKKLVSWALKEQLSAIVQIGVEENSSTEETAISTESATISTLLVELISKVLKENSNYDLMQIGLSISNDLFKKCSPFIIEEFSRLGVGHLISQLARDADEDIDESQEDEDEEDEEEEKAENVPDEEQERVNEVGHEEEATEIQPDKVNFS